MVDKPFATVTYTRAVELLLESGHSFEFTVRWGSDLQSEHERYLTEVVFKGTPLIVTDYPKEIKVGWGDSGVMHGDWRACGTHGRLYSAQGMRGLKWQGIQ